MKVCAVVCSFLCQLLTSYSQFATFILAALAAVATASAVEVAGPVPPLGSDLEARVRLYSLHELVRCLLTHICLNEQACVASKCRCNKVQGQFCGNQAVNSYCTNGHVFECNASTGKTCDYGVRNSCVKCGKLSC